MILTLRSAEYLIQLPFEAGINRYVIKRCPPGSDSPYAIDQTSLYLKSKVLSRTHAELTFRNNKVYIKDCGSSNGTYINDQRLSEENEPSKEIEMKHGDQLQFGLDIYDPDNSDVIMHKKLNYSIIYPNDIVMATITPATPDVVSILDQEILMRSQHLSRQVERTQQIVNTMIAPTAPPALDGLNAQGRMWKEKYEALASILEDHGNYHMLY